MTCVNNLTRFEKKKYPRLVLFWYMHDWWIVIKKKKLFISCHSIGDFLKLCCEVLHMLALITQATVFVIQFLLIFLGAKATLKLPFISWLIDPNPPTAFDMKCHKFIAKSFLFLAFLKLFRISKLFFFSKRRPCQEMNAWSRYKLFLR